MSLCGERASARLSRAERQRGGKYSPSCTLSLSPFSLRTPPARNARCAQELEWICILDSPWNQVNEIHYAGTKFMILMSIWKHTGTLGNTPCGHCRPPSCRGKMYTQHGESGTPWNLLNNFPSCTLADSHTDKYINLLSHYNDCPTFTILSAESLAALGRSRQSFSQFCSNFSSGHFAAQEGKKAAHNIWRKRERIRKRKEEATANSIGLDRLGGGWPRKRRRTIVRVKYCDYVANLVTCAQYDEEGTGTVGQYRLIC